MKIKKKIFLINIFLFFICSSIGFAHTSHYKNLNKLEFNLYRNNQFIGTHIYTFDRDNNKLLVKSVINFEIKKLGLTLYKYSALAEEKYINDKLVSFSSTTNQNKKEKFCNIFFKDNSLFIEGSSFKGEMPKDSIIGTWWNHSIIDKNSQISAVSGRIIEQNVKFLGDELLELNGKSFQALKFNFSSSDPKLSKEKKLNTTIWYDKETLIWLKAAFKKTGNWEYRLKSYR